MGAFAVLVAFGLQLVPGRPRSIVLGYTTPLWVAPAAWLFLRRAHHALRTLPAARVGARRARHHVQSAGVRLERRPRIDRQRPAPAGGAVLGGQHPLCARPSDGYRRRFNSCSGRRCWPPRSCSAAGLGRSTACREVSWTPELVGAFAAYGGICGTALAHWAIAMVNRSLPAVTTSLGLLATPVVGAWQRRRSALGEPHQRFPDAGAMALIIGGIALGTFTHRQQRH